MKTGFKQETRRPLELTESGLRHIDTIRLAVRGIIMREIASSEGLQVAELEAALAGTCPPGLKDYQHESLVERITRQIATDYTVRFAGGISVTSSSIEEIIQRLMTESAKPERFSAETAATSFRFDLELGGYVRTAELTLTGHRADIDHIAQAVENFYRTAAPSFAWCHSKWAARTAIPAMMLLTLISVLSISPWLARSIGWQKDQFNNTTAGATTVISIATGFGAGWLLRQALPPFEIKVGPAYRRRNALKGAFAALVSLLLIPIVLHALGLT